MRLTRLAPPDKRYVASPQGGRRSIEAARPEIGQMRSYVVEMPRPARPLFEGALGPCLRFIVGRAAPGMARLGLVVSTPPPAEGPDAVVCVPASAFGDWEARAAAVVADWERLWLLIESMPPHHRGEARADLHHAVAAALVAAAVNGVDAVGRPDDVLF